MSKQKATTAHGEIEYETVQCQNCENDVLKEEAIPIHIDPKAKYCNGVSICDAEHPYPKQESMLCPYCSKTIFGYKRGHLSDFETIMTRVKWDFANALLFLIAVSVVVFGVLSIVAMVV